MNKWCKIFLAVLFFFAVAGFETAHSFDFKLGDIKLPDLKKLKKGFKKVQKVQKAFQELNEEEQYYIGRSVGARLLADNKLLKGKELRSYVSNIGQILALASTRPETFKGYHFIVLNEPGRVNAYAAPSGFIFLTTGLINKASNEDELAGILAHEIAHVVSMHAIDSIRKVYKDELKKDVMEFAVKKASKKVKNKQLSSLVGGLNKLSDMIIDNAAKGYSREKEDKADELAVSIMVSAGYAPTALAAVLEKLEPVGSGGSGTHGDPKNRRDHVNSVIDAYGEVPALVATRSERFGKVMNGSN